MGNEKEGKLVPILELSPEIIPKSLPQRAIYSKEQILKMFEIYTDVAYRVGIAIGLGSELRDPSIEAAKTLRELKEKADSLPIEIRQNFPKVFNELEYLLRYYKR